MTFEEQTYAVKPIGWLRTDFQQKFGTPRQGSLAKSSRAHIELSPQWANRGILKGLEGFSHVWVLTYLHLSNFSRMSAKIRPPRLRGEKIGVMGSRSPHRPNNIGLTLAKILRCEGDFLELAEVDIVDGTPVLDLKPYLASADRPEVYSGGWTDQVGSIDKTCTFTPQAEQALTALVGQGIITDAGRIKTLIVEMLSLDPRPPSYLNKENPQFYVWVAGLNVHFTFSKDEFLITMIERSTV